MSAGSEVSLLKQGWATLNAVIFIARLLTWSNCACPLYEGRPDPE